MFFQLLKRYGYCGLFVIFLSNNLLFSSLSNNTHGFTSDTLVAAKGGYVPIAQLKVDDEIISYNTEKKAYVIDKILKIQKEKTKEIIRLAIDDSFIEVAPNHKFYTNQGWIEARHLKEKRTELKCLLDKLRINAIDEITKEADVYCLSVEKNHNFFVTKNGVLVHNVIPILGALWSWLSPVAVPAAKMAAKKAIVPIAQKVAIYLSNNFGIKLGITLFGGGVIVAQNFKSKVTLSAQRAKFEAEVIKDEVKKSGWAKTNISKTSNTNLIKNISDNWRVKNSSPFVLGRPVIRAASSAVDKLKMSNENYHARKNSSGDRFRKQVGLAVVNNLKNANKSTWQHDTMEQSSTDESKENSYQEKPSPKDQYKPNYYPSYPTQHINWTGKDESKVKVNLPFGVNIGVNINWSYVPGCNSKGYWRNSEGDICHVRGGTVASKQQVAQDPFLQRDFGFDYPELTEEQFKDQGRAKEFGFQVDPRYYEYKAKYLGQKEFSFPIDRDPFNLDPANLCRRVIPVAQAVQTGQSFVSKTGEFIQSIPDAISDGFDRLDHKIDSFKRKFKNRNEKTSNNGQQKGYTLSEFAQKNNLPKPNYREDRGNFEATDALGNKIFLNRHFGTIKDKEGNFKTFGKYKLDHYGYPIPVDKNGNIDTENIFIINKEGKYLDISPDEYASQKIEESEYQKYKQKKAEQERNFQEKEWLEKEREEYYQRRNNNTNINLNSNQENDVQREGKEKGSKRSSKEPEDPENKNRSRASRWIRKAWTKLTNKQQKEVARENKWLETGLCDKYDNPVFKDPKTKRMYSFDESGHGGSWFKELDRNLKRIWSCDINGVRLWE